MTTALGLAAVTAVLRGLLQGFLVDEGVGTIVPGADVTALSPDRLSTGTTRPVGLNLFCYGVSQNPGWRNESLPSRSGEGARLSNPPLALDLHYLLTAYGTDDLHAEVLLGYGMQRLHEVPMLERETIRSILQDPAILSGRLADAGLADQVEAIRVAPEVLGTEEVGKLWTAFQSAYRPSAAYRASVVLIQAREPVRSPLPVLTRGAPDPASGREEGVVVVPGLELPVPTVEALDTPTGIPVVRLGDTIRLTGHHLAGTAHDVVFEHATLTGVSVRVAPDAVSEESVEVTLPGAAPGDWAAGIFSVRVTLIQDGEDRTTNALPLGLAPDPDFAGATVSPAGPVTTIALPVLPPVRPEQEAVLIVGDRQVTAAGRTAVASSLDFLVEDPTAGTHPSRLRVGGVESLLVDRTTVPPTFDPSHQLTF